MSDRSEGSPPADARHVLLDPMPRPMSRRGAALLGIISVVALRWLLG